jgi:DNA (cytosine-5)-methyltransferase 1
VEVTHLDLFSGIGGFAIAAQNCGYTTIGFCEKEKYAQQILKERFGAVMANAVPSGQWRESRKGKAKIHDDIFTLNGADYAGVDLLTGGFPCQPFSVAGKRRGAEDDRAIWPEMLRVIRESGPRWLIGENVAGIVTMELDNIISDLEVLGYTAWPLVIPACAVDAKHRRDRVWIVAHAERGGQSGSREPVRSVHQKANRNRTNDCGEAGQQNSGQLESSVLRMVDGLPERLDSCGVDKEKERHTVMGYGTPKTTRRKEELPAMRKADGAKTLPEQLGGSSVLSTEEVLRPALHGKTLHQGEGDSGRAAQASGEVSRDGVRRVQDDEESGGASSGREPGEQRDGKPNDAVWFVSHEMALEERQAYCQWPEEDAGTPRINHGIPNRAHRLRGLGNAIVPQVAEEIIRAITEVTLPT